MLFLTSNEQVNSIKLSLGTNSGSISFKIYNKFYYRRLFNLHGKGPCYIRFKHEKYCVSELVIKLQKV